MPGEEVTHIRRRTIRSLASRSSTRQVPKNLNLEIPSLHWSRVEVSDIIDSLEQTEANARALLKRTCSQDFHPESIFRSLSWVMGTHNVNLFLFG